MTDSNLADAIQVMKKMITKLPIKPVQAVKKGPPAAKAPPKKKAKSDCSVSSLAADSDISDNSSESRFEMDSDVQCDSDSSRHQASKPQTAAASSDAPPPATLPKGRPGKPDAGKTADAQNKPAKVTAVKKKRTSSAAPFIVDRSKILNHDDAMDFE